MCPYPLSHLSDSALLRELDSIVARERAVTSALLAHLGEVDSRRLYLGAAYPSMFAFCVGELRFSEEAAFKRIRAARMARRFPVILEMLADGGLHLTAVVMLASVLTEENARELLAASVHRSKAEIEKLLAERFPRPDLPERIDVLAAPPVAPGLGIDSQLSPGTVASCRTVATEPAGEERLPPPIARPMELAPAAPPTATAAPEHRQPPVPGGCEVAATIRGRLTPLAPRRYALQVTVGQRTHDKLRQAQELLRHVVPDGDLETVLDRALDLLVRDLEKRRFAATGQPARATSRPGANPRHIPAAVRREVWKRDGGRCTFVSDSGRRCDARGHLEFDHELPVARGGRATAGNLRLRCRAHNQYEAERAYGVPFMDSKRASGRERRAQRSRVAARDSARDSAPC